MHTIATAYYLRMSNDPSVEESMRYALGVMKQNTRVTPIRRLKSPKRKKNKSNSNNTNNINKVSNGRTSNGQKMVDYVKQKLGIYSKFDKAEFLKKSRLFIFTSGGIYLRVKPLLRIVELFTFDP